MKTLNETLAALGYTTAPAGHYRKRIINADGETVYTGAAHQVWLWLRETEQINAGCEPVRRETPPPRSATATTKPPNPSRRARALGRCSPPGVRVAG